MILQILYLMFSVNCDSLNTDVYNFSRKLKEVEFCKCVSRKSFVNSVIIPEVSKDDKKECQINDLDSLVVKYKKIKKELR